MNTQSPFRVLLASSDQDRREWQRLLQTWTEREVYADPNYVGLYGDENNLVMCASWVSEEGTVLFPFLLRNLRRDNFAAVPNSLFDLTSPYGYGGPFVWDCEDAILLAGKFWQAFDKWARESNVVSEFVRFSLFDNSLLPGRYAKQYKQDNIVRDLTLTEHELWMDFEHKVRKNVKSAIRRGVEIVVDSSGASFDEFYDIYVGTMQRRAAEDDYYFPVEYFEAIHNGLPGQFAYFHAWLDGKVVSSELVLLSQKTIYSFLGGTNRDAFSARPNDLLKFEIMKWAKRNGRDRFVLGGGYAPDDGIFRYKRAFAPEGNVPFSVGTRINSRTSYEKLLEQKASETNGWAPDPGFFPAYRS